MRLAPPGSRRPHLAITATLIAAGLVLYLQHRAIATLESQTEVILRQMSDQTASDIARQVRRTLEGPIFDTLTAVNHPELRAGRLDLVARQYEEGLREYPHVDRFFAWHAERDGAAPDRVLFYGREGGFRPDPAFGEMIVALAQKYAPTQHIYVAAEGLGPTKRHQVFLRLFWSDASRVDYFAVLGFVVDPELVRTRLFDTLYTSQLASVLRRRGGDVPLQMQVMDERGVRVFGPEQSQEIAAQVTFPMRFYPADEIESRLAASVPAHRWTIRVSAAPPGGGVTGLGQTYWPTVLSVLLMLVAVTYTVQANRRAADLARMQADFISHVSHQLKTPLSLLSAASETLAMERVRSPEKLSQYLGTIRGEVTRLSALVQRILEFSRLQQPRSYEFEVLDLGPLVRETVDAFARSLSRQGFTFTVEEDGPTPHVRADSAALEQSLANLLDNAVKYSGDARDVTVRVRTAGNEARIEVTDNGVGISDADQRRIFEKFYRGAAASLQRQGFGLGLPVVQELVAAHRGRVEVESQIGCGSTFRIILPAHTPLQEATPNPAALATTRESI
jgi:nitrogen-specific signal transduction histidine kinase